MTKKQILDKYLELVKEIESIEYDEDKFVYYANYIQDYYETTTKEQISSEIDGLFKIETNLMFPSDGMQDLALTTRAIGWRSYRSRAVLSTYEELVEKISIYKKRDDIPVLPFHVRAALNPDFSKAMNIFSIEDIILTPDNPDAKKEKIVMMPSFNKQEQQMYDALFKGKENSKIDMINHFRGTLDFEHWRDNHLTYARLEQLLDKLSLRNEEKWTLTRMIGIPVALDRLRGAHDKLNTNDEANAIVHLHLRDTLIEDWHTYGKIIGRNEYGFLFKRLCWGILSSLSLFDKINQINCTYLGYVISSYLLITATNMEYKLDPIEFKRFKDQKRFEIINIEPLEFNRLDSEIQSILPDELEHYTEDSLIESFNERIEYTDKIRVKNTEAVLSKWFEIKEKLKKYLKKSKDDKGQKMKKNLLKQIITLFYNLPNSETENLDLVLKFLSNEDQILLSNLLPRKGEMINKHSALKEALLFSYISLSGVELIMEKRYELFDKVMHLINETSSTILASLLRIRKVLLSYTPTFYYSLINRNWAYYKLKIKEQVWNL